MYLNIKINFCPFISNNIKGKHNVSVLFLVVLGDQTWGLAYARQVLYP
jgi:hypothetical protein